MTTARRIKTSGKVIRVLDGDTIEVAVKIRLNRIDSPETKGIEKEAGIISKEYLIDRLEGKRIDLEIASNDVYRRLLSEVLIEGTNINDELLDKHLAEVYSVKNHNNGVLDV